MPKQRRRLRSVSQSACEDCVESNNGSCLESSKGHNEVDIKDKLKQSYIFAVAGSVSV